MTGVVGFIFIFFFASHSFAFGDFTHEYLLVSYFLNVLLTWIMIPFLFLSPTFSHLCDMYREHAAAGGGKMNC